MTTHSDIENTLVMLDGYYNEPSTSTDMATLYSKLAKIELCCWLEVCMDSIDQSFISRKTLTPKYSDIFENIKKKVMGIGWNDHFTKMLLPTIGICEMDKIETIVNNAGLIDVLTAELTDLSKKETKLHILITFQLQQLHMIHLL